jgi:hypothetical protein
VRSYAKGTHLNLRGTWDRNDILTLREDPCNAHRAGFRAVLRTDFLHLLRYRVDLWEVLLRVLRNRKAEVALLKVFRSRLKSD